MGVFVAKKKSRLITYEDEFQRLLLVDGLLCRVTCKRFHPCVPAIVCRTALCPGGASDLLVGTGPSVGLAPLRVRVQLGFASFSRITSAFVRSSLPVDPRD